MEANIFGTISSVKLYSIIDVEEWKNIIIYQLFRSPKNKEKF